MQPIGFIHQIEFQTWFAHIAAHSAIAACIHHQAA